MLAGKGSKDRGRRKEICSPDAKQRPWTIKRRRRKGGWLLAGAGDDGLYTGKGRWVLVREGDVASSQWKGTEDSGQGMGLGKVDKGCSLWDGTTEGSGMMVVRGGRVR